MKIGQKTLRMAAASLFVLGMIALVASPAEARWRQGGSGRRGMAGQPGFPGMLDRITHQLDLTDEQAERIHGIAEEGRQEAKVVADAREAFHKAVADGTEEEQIRSAAEALGKALGDQAVLRAKTLASVREVLSEEQRDQLKGQVGPFRGGPGRRESRDGMRPGQGNRPRRMGNPGPRGPWQGERGPARWSQDRPGAAGRRGRGAQLRGTMRGRRQRDMNWDQVSSPAPGPWRADRMPWSDQGPQVGRRGPGGRGGRGPLPIDRMFERADTNDDGALDKEEIEAFRSGKADGSEARLW